MSIPPLEAGEQATQRFAGDRVRVHRNEWPIGRGKNAVVLDGADEAVA